MAHVMIASKAVDRLMETDDEIEGMRTCVEKDFSGKISPDLDHPSR